MKIFLIRHGKSDKSLEDKLTPDEFEFKRPLVEGEEEKARRLGETLKKQIDNGSSYDFVHSGKVRSRQTVLAIAGGVGVLPEVAQANLREDFGLTYLADKEYWKDAEHAVKNGQYVSHADFFLANLPQEYFSQKNITNPGQTFSAEYMRQNMRSVLRRAIERNTFLNNDTVIMVSHEPVISLCMSDLTEKSVGDLGGQCTELEYAVFSTNESEGSLVPQIELSYRGENYEVASKLFPL